MPLTKMGEVEYKGKLQETSNTKQHTRKNKLIKVSTMCAFYIILSSSSIVYTGVVTYQLSALFLLLCILSLSLSLFRFCSIALNICLQCSGLAFVRAKYLNMLTISNPFHLVDGIEFPKSFYAVQLITKGFILIHSVGIIRSNTGCCLKKISGDVPSTSLLK